MHQNLFTAAAVRIAHTHTFLFSLDSSQTIMEKFKYVDSSYFFSPIADLLLIYSDSIKVLTTRMTNKNKLNIFLGILWVFASF